MANSETKSEVARLRQRLEEEYRAAQLGLTGLAAGAARHDFINRKMENMGKVHEKLKRLMGEQEAARVLVEVLETE